MLKKLNIAQKFVLTLTLTVGFAILLTVILLNTHLKQEHGKLFFERVELIADMVSYNTLAPVAFADKKRSLEALSVVTEMDDVVYACLYSTQINQELASYSRSEKAQRECTSFPSENFQSVNKRETALYKILKLKDREVGGLYIVVSNERQVEQRKNMVLVLIFSSAFSFCLALLVTMKLSVSLYRPIIDLQKVSQRITSKKDWSLRASKLGEDEVGQLVDTFNMMLETIERDQGELKRLAYYDALTGVPNRRLLEHRIYRAIARSGRNQMNFAIIFIDLDDFKWVNDTLGHDMGDVLLKTITERVGDSLREDDTLARFGGDEFVILAERVNSDDEANQICARVLQSLEKPIMLKDVRYQAKVSLGGVNADYNDRDMYELLKQADIALYAAKKGGKNQYCIYTDDMKAEDEE